MNEVKLLIAQMNDEVKSQPGETAAAIVEVTPLAVRALADLACGKKASILHRLRAVDALLKLRRMIITEGLRRQALELRSKTTALRHREADVQAIESRLKLIEAKTRKMAEDRKRRADLRRDQRILTAARKLNAT